MPIKSCNRLDIFRLILDDVFARLGMTVVNGRPKIIQQVFNTAHSTRFTDVDKQNICIENHGLTVILQTCSQRALQLQILEVA